MDEEGIQETREKKKDEKWEIIESRLEEREEREMIYEV